jgi:RNA polymerase sigma-70 factor (ECF subfamily)
LQEADERGRFEAAFLPHLGAAHNLARWLVRDEQEAQDMVQEAFLRAWKSLEGFQGKDGRTWLLAIVRNVCYSCLEKKRRRGPALPFDERVHGVAAGDRNPESLLERKDEQQTMRQAVEQLPDELREVVVLRELEGLSYKEIAAVAAIPVGTVMSRLARARDRLHQRLTSQSA